MNRVESEPIGLEFGRKAPLDPGQSSGGQELKLKHLCFGRDKFVHFFKVWKRQKTHRYLRFLARVKASHYVPSVVNKLIRVRMAHSGNYA